MKITTTGNIEVYSTYKIHFNVFDDLGRLVPHSMKFNIEILNPTLQIPMIQNLTIEEWLTAMLDNKIIIKASDSNLTSEYINFLTKLSLIPDNPFLVVENTNLYYISKTLFLILKKLLTDIPQSISSQVTLVSLEYE